MICRSQDEENAHNQRQPGIGLVECRGDEEQHQAEKRGEGQPVKKLKNGVRSVAVAPWRHLPTSFWYQRLHSLEPVIKKTCNPVDGKARNRPGRDDPERRALVGVVEPQVCLCAPGLDRQAPADADEDNEQIPFEIRAGETTKVDVRLRAGVRQRFDIDLPAKIEPSWGSLRILRGADIVANAWAITAGW